MSTTASAYDAPDVAQAAELDDRDIRALITPMTVVDDCGDARDHPDVYEVTTDSGSEYLVNTDTRSCTCPDHEYRDACCKHLRRVEFAVGDRTIPGWVSFDAVDSQLGQHVAGQPRVAMADGGTRPLTRSHDTTPARRAGYETERVDDAGILVFNDDGAGRELVGFAGVDDWDAVRSELARRGLSVGAIHHKDVFSLAELDVVEGDR